MFEKIMSEISKALKSGNLELARELLDNAWNHASEPTHRTLAHDIGNKIQKAIFKEYLKN